MARALVLVASLLAASTALAACTGVPRSEAGDPTGLSPPPASPVPSRELSPPPPGDRPSRTPSPTPADPSVSESPPVQEPAAPADFRFEDRAATPADLGAAWREGCPVGPDVLRAVTLTHWTFDGSVATGELVLHADVVEPARSAFARLFELRFPIRSVQRITDAGADPLPALSTNTSYGFQCREAVRDGPPAWSQHAFGRAIDINPVENPYVLGERILPAEGAAYVDRTPRPGMLLAGSPQLAAFTDVGFEWGGVWRSPDPMHLQLP